MISDSSNTNLRYINGKLSETYTKLGNVINKYNLPLMKKEYVKDSKLQKLAETSFIVMVLCFLLVITGIREGEDNEMWYFVDFALIVIGIISLIIGLITNKRADNTEIYELKQYNYIVITRHNGLTMGMYDWVSSEDLRGQFRPQKENGSYEVNLILDNQSIIRITQENVKTKNGIINTLCMEFQCSYIEVYKGLLKYIEGSGEDECTSYRNGIRMNEMNVTYEDYKPFRIYSNNLNILNNLKMIIESTYGIIVM